MVIKINVNVPLPISDLIKVTDLSGENVPVATNDDKPAGGQIVSAVIAKNKEATINDFNVPDDSVKVTKKPNDGPPYEYGTYTAKAVGAGKYNGEIDINGTFGRLNPFYNYEQYLKNDKTKEINNKNNKNTKGK